jgi:hypothetical protein
MARWATAATRWYVAMSRWSEWQMRSLAHLCQKAYLADCTTSGDASGAARLPLSPRQHTRQQHLLSPPPRLLRAVDGPGAVGPGSGSQLLTQIAPRTAARPRTIPAMARVQLAAVAVVRTHAPRLPRSAVPPARPRMVTRGTARAQAATRALDIRASRTLSRAAQPHQPSSPRQRPASAIAISSAEGF